MKNQKKGLLSLADLWVLAVGQVIGAGVITTIGPAMGLTGPSVWLAYFAAIILGLIINLPIMVFSSITKFSGGDYSVISGLGGERQGVVVKIGKGAYRLVCVNAGKKP